jgi:hypothetical protein
LEPAYGIEGSVARETLAAALPADRLKCVQLLDSDSTISYDYASAAGQFAQINGVLAALVFAALVFILERSHSSDYAALLPPPLILLPLTFGVAVLSAYQYSIVNSYALCETVAALAMVAAPSFAFVVLAIIATMATMFSEIEGAGGRSAFVVTVALYGATTLLAIANVAITVFDMSATFGLAESPNVIAAHTLMGLTAAGVVLVTFYLLVERRYASKVPVLRRTTQQAVVFGIAGLSAMFIVGSGVLFAVTAIVPDWTSVHSAEAVGRLLAKYGWVPPMLTGLMAGLLASLMRWAQAP